MVIIEIKPEPFLINKMQTILNYQALAESLHFTK